MNPFNGDETGLGVVHFGSTALDDSAHLVRESGEGRAFVLVERTAGSQASALLEAALSKSQMSARFSEVSGASFDAQKQIDVAAEFASFSGGALISIGSSHFIGAAKAVAALATNRLKRRGFGLTVAPRTHLAVPVGLGPAEEGTSLTVDPVTQEPIIDDRLPAMSIIDARLFSDYEPASETYKSLAVRLATCVATDDDASLRDRTLALSAAHHLIGPDLRPADIRRALALASAGHRRWPLCQRCDAGTRLPSDRFTRDNSPAWRCLQQAVARGLPVSLAG